MNVSKLIRWSIVSCLLAAQRSQVPTIVTQRPFILSEDGKSIRYKLIVTDPTTFTAPVELTKRWLALPGAKVEPYECVI